MKKMTISADEVSDDITFLPNKGFDGEQEIVVRMGDFSSDRTFGLKADKACADLKNELILKLKNPEQKIIILIRDI